MVCKNGGGGGVDHQCMCHGAGAKVGWNKEYLHSRCSPATLM